MIRFEIDVNMYAGHTARVISGPFAAIGRDGQVVAEIWPTDFRTRRALRRALRRIGGKAAIAAFDKACREGQALLDARRR